MSDPIPPPPQFVEYPRASRAAHGTLDQLQALAEGYFGLNWVFLVNLLLVFATRAASASAGMPGLVAMVLVLLVAVGGLSYPMNKKIGFGLGWPGWGAALASILMAINSALFCGIIGYVVMQNLALTEMKRYGIPGSSFSLRKKVVMAFIERMRAGESQS